MIKILQLANQGLLTKKQKHVKLNETVKLLYYLIKHDAAVLRKKTETSSRFGCSMTEQQTAEGDAGPRHKLRAVYEF